ncbi:MAG: HAD family hydrolase [Candidatus Ozemobacteraceae bacterium]
MIFPPIKAIFWDLDGTLAYWHDLRVISRTARLYLSLRPSDISWGFALLSATKAYLQILRNSGSINNDALYKKMLSRSWKKPEAEIQEMTRNLLRHPDLSEILRTSIRPIPEAFELVDLVHRQQRPQLVATNPVMPCEFNRLRLSIAGYDTSGFQYISGSEDFVGQKKSVDFYHRLLEISGFQPEDCLMIGNDPSKDLIARKAGILVFLLRNPFTVSAPFPESCEPHWEGTYADLKNILEESPTSHV